MVPIQGRSRTTCNFFMARKQRCDYTASLEHELNGKEHDVSQSGERMDERSQEEDRHFRRSILFSEISLSHSIELMGLRLVRAREALEVFSAPCEPHMG